MYKIKTLVIAPRIHQNNLKTLLLISRLSNVVVLVNKRTKLDEKMHKRMSLHSLNRIFGNFNWSSRFYIFNPIPLLIYTLNFKPDLLVLREHTLLHWLFISLYAIFYRFNFFVYTQSLYDDLFDTFAAPYSLIAKSPKKLLKRIAFDLLSKRTNLCFITPKVSSAHNNSSKILVLPLSVDNCNVKPKQIPDNIFKIITVSKFQRRKKIEDSLHLLNYLMNDDTTKKFSLDIVAQTNISFDTGYYTEIRSLIDDMSLSDHVSIKQNISTNILSQMYSKSHLFVLPSIYEPASVSQYEALQSGCLCILSHDNGAKYELYGNCPDMLYINFKNLVNFQEIRSFMLNNDFSLAARRSRSSYYSALFQRDRRLRFKSILDHTFL